MLKELWKPMLINVIDTDGSGYLLSEDACSPALHKDVIYLTLFFSDLMAYELIGYLQIT